MRKLLTVLASAAMVVGLGAPAWASDNAPSADQPITQRDSDFEPDLTPYCRRQPTGERTR